MARLAIKDLKNCLRIYYTYPEIGTSEIMELFGVGRATATTLKKSVRKAQIENGIMVLDKTTVHTETAYKVWGIDIDDIERRIKKLEELGLYKSQENGEREE